MTTHRAKPPTFLVLLLHFDEFFANRVIVQCEVGSSRIDGLLGYDSPAAKSFRTLLRIKFYWDIWDSLMTLDSSLSNMTYDESSENRKGIAPMRHDS